MQILAFSDLHGDVATLKLLKENIKDENYDCILVAEDLTSADLLPPTERLQQVQKIFSIMESFKISYYYVWGTPFREGTLRFAQNNYEVKEHKGKLTLTMKSDGGTWTTEMTQKGWQLFRKIEHFLSSLRFGKHLKESKPVKLGKYWLTSSQKGIPKNAIFLRYHYRKIIPKVLIQLDGHLHYGQRVLNYLNLGFLYRDAAHGASPMIGCYWKLTLKDYTVSVDFKNLGNSLKEFKCPDHLKEGTFYIPSYWKKCPICFKPAEALIKRENGILYYNRKNKNGHTKSM